MAEELTIDKNQELTSPEATEREEWVDRIREGYVADIASQLHNNWRKSRLQENGAYEPRVKQTKDEAWIEANGTDQVDIANTEYLDLPEDWQRENKDAARVIFDMIDNPQTREIATSVYDNPSPAGNIVHDAWLDRNEWASGSELDKPFDELPAHEQEKDIDQVKIGNRELGFDQGETDSILNNTKNQHAETSAETETPQITGGDFLRAHRESRGLKLRDIERASGFNSGYLSQLERGNVKSINTTTLPRIAEAYGVSQIDLLKAYGVEIPESVERTAEEERALKLGRRILELSEESVRQFEIILNNFKT